MSDYTSPDVRNYTIGKGSVFFTPVGGVRRHLGNAVAFEVELTIEELDHFSSMSGVRTKDLVAVLEKSGVIRVNLEEITAENLRIALMGGELDVDTEGNKIFEIMAANLTRGRLEFVGNNDVGPKWTYDFPSVAFRPNGAINQISDDWMILELEGEIEAVNGKFGTATLQNSADTTETTTEDASE
jgi:hypothetical protein